MAEIAATVAVIVVGQMIVRHIYVAVVAVIKVVMPAAVAAVTVIAIADLIHFLKPRLCRVGDSCSADFSEFTVLILSVRTIIVKLKIVKVIFSAHSIPVIAIDLRKSISI